MGRVGRGGIITGLEGSEGVEVGKREGKESGIIDSCKQAIRARESKVN